MNSSSATAGHRARPCRRSSCRHRRAWSGTPPSRHSRYRASTTRCVSFDHRDAPLRPSFHPEGGAWRAPQSAHPGRATSTCRRAGSLSPTGRWRHHSASGTHLLHRPGTSDQTHSHMRRQAVVRREPGSRRHRYSYTTGESVHQARDAQSYRPRPGAIRCARASCRGDRSGDGRPSQSHPSNAIPWIGRPVCRRPRSAPAYCRERSTVADHARS